MSTPRFSASEVAAELGGPVALLGAGAYGDTWRRGGTAVKIICVDGYPTQRVNREVAGLRRVDSPYVVKLLDVYTVNLGGQERPALEFEYIAGGDVAARIESAEWPTADQALSMLRGLLVGVGDMHATGTVHRDIKPGNIGLRDGDWSRPVVLDLGLARGMDETTITVYPGHVGTVWYMAPEQLEGRPARKAADLFAVGVTVRQVLGHRHPFYDDGVSYTFDEAVVRIQQGPCDLPTGGLGRTIELLDRLVAAPEHERGSAMSSLRRLDDAMGTETR
jgi:serine/threonine-protein kinase